MQGLTSLMKPIGRRYQSVIDTSKCKQDKSDGTLTTLERFCCREVFCYLIFLTNSFQMSIKPPTSGGQTQNQEAAVKRTFHLERSGFFYLSALVVMTRCRACILHVSALNIDPDSCPPEVRPRPMKTIYRSAQLLVFWLYQSFIRTSHMYYTKRKAS